MPKASLGRISVAAGLPDFLFDLKLNVSSFKVKVPGQVAIPVSGRGLNPRAKAAISKARRNDVITILISKHQYQVLTIKLKSITC